MSVIGAIRVIMGIDTAAYESGLRRAEGRTRRASTTIQRSFLGLRSAAAPLIGALAAVFSGAMIKRALDQAAAIGEVAQQLGVTTRDLQVYRYVATQVNLSQEQMDRGLQRLTRSIGEAAHGARQQGDAFKALGIDVRDAEGRIKSTGEVMRELADKIAAIPDAASRAAVLVRLFGRAGQQFLPLFEQGAAGIERFTREAEELGMVLSEDEIANADRTADKIEQLNAALRANLSRVVAQNADAILGLATAIATLTGRVVQFIASNPTRAAQLIGGLGGAGIGARFGPWGAAIGGAGGFLLGSRAASTEASAAQRRAWMSREQRNVALRSLLGAAPGDRAWARVVERHGGLNSPRVRRAFNSPGVQRSHRRMRAAEAAAARASAAAAAAATPDVPDIPPIDLGDFAGSGGGGGRKSRDDSERERRERLRREHELASDMRRFDLEALREREAQAADHAERRTLRTQMLDLERAQYAAELQLRVDLEELTGVQRDQLLAAHDTVDGWRRWGEHLQTQEELARERGELADADYEIAAGILRQEIDLATTAAERRDAELRLLDLTYQHQRAKLEAIAADERAGHVAQERARRELEALGQWRRNEGRGIRRSTMGPLERFVFDLPDTAAEMNEALQAVAADGLASLTDGLAEALAGTRSLADAFSDMARRIIADLLRIAIQQAIIQPLAEALLNLTGGRGGLGNLFGGGGGGTGNAAWWIGDPGGLAPGFATGGSFRVVGQAGVDQNLLSMRVSAGEMVDIRRPGMEQARQATAGIVEIRLRNALLDARIEAGAGIVVTRLHPTMKADTIRTLRDSRRRSG